MILTLALFVEKFALDINQEKLAQESTRKKYIANMIQHDFASFIDRGPKTAFISQFTDFEGYYAHVRNFTIKKYYSIKERDSQNTRPFFEQGNSLRRTKMDPLI